MEAMWTEWMSGLLVVDDDTPESSVGGGEHSDVGQCNVGTEFSRVVDGERSHVDESVFAIGGDRFTAKTRSTK